MNTADVVNPITTRVAMSLASSRQSYCDLPGPTGLILPNPTALVFPGPTHLVRPGPAHLWRPDLPCKSMGSEDYLVGLYSGQTDTCIIVDPNGRPMPLRVDPPLAPLSEGRILEGYPQEQQQVSPPVPCRTDEARNWYGRLGPGQSEAGAHSKKANQLAPYNNRSFFASTTRHAQGQILARLENLVKIKQRQDEPLKDYSQRFMAEATRVTGLIEEGRYTAILRGILPLSDFWKDIRRISTNEMEFLERVDGFIKLEEAVRQAQIRGCDNDEQTQGLIAPEALSKMLTSADYLYQFSNNENSGEKHKNDGSYQRMAKEGNLMIPLSHEVQERRRGSVYVSLFYQSSQSTACQDILAGQVNNRKSEGWPLSLKSAPGSEGWPPSLRSCPCL
uniref:Retrotransposon gag domain-containing protein n=1 Tax=Cannabis sativa TaxID=3483 RepID=A0A803QDY4_CANSA